MTAKTHIAVTAHPDVHLRVAMKPLELEIAGQASFALTTGDIHIRCDEIPITLAIPFLARRVAAGSIGAFGIRIKPFEAQFRALGLDARGVLGREGAEADVHATGHCGAEIEVSGKLAGDAAAAAKKILEE